MKRTAAYLLPLWMLLFGIAFTCAVDGVNLNVERTGTNQSNLRVYVTNNTFWYARFEYSNDLQTWRHYRTDFSEPGDPIAHSLEFTIKGGATNNSPMTFWRLVDRPMP